ncbi:MAG: Nif3-like dinuclear metal center hexameric protein [Caldicoprobacterales bacterium]|jgi:dinuclear metal center YbgI/SA1388 family protein|nr:Nif3-like dinuclear metal center hexameric protein [Clostridiales bacterium]
MFCSVERVAQLMDDIAPIKWAEEWDNVGLLLGYRGAKVERLMVVLDISPAVVEEAVKKNVDMIIAHHPLIFSPLKRIVDDSLVGRLILPLASHNIAVYCAHTNLDMTMGGVDDTLARLLGLNKINYLNLDDAKQSSKPGVGRWGKLESPIPLMDFIKLVGKALNIPSLDVIKSTGTRDDKKIHTVALCAGSGADYMTHAKKIGADIFVTGEIKYHDALTAHWLGIDVLAAGHFYTELPIVKELISRLQMIMDSLQYKVEIIESEMQMSPYSRIFIEE